MFELDGGAQVCRKFFLESGGQKMNSVDRSMIDMEFPVGIRQITPGPVACNTEHLYPVAHGLQQQGIDVVVKIESGQSGRAGPDGTHHADLPLPLKDGH